MRDIISPMVNMRTALPTKRALSFDDPLTNELQLTESILMLHVVEIEFPGTCDCGDES